MIAHIPDLFLCEANSGRKRQSAGKNIIGIGTTKAPNGILVRKTWLMIKRIEEPPDTDPLLIKISANFFRVIKEKINAKRDTLADFCVYGKLYPRTIF